MEVGKLEILGTINVEGIKSGLNQMRNSLEGAKVHAKGLFADMERLGSSLKGFGKGVLAVTALSAGLLTLGSVAPGVQMAFKRMELDTWRLGMAVGEQLTPTISGLADGYNSLVDILVSDKSFLEKAKEVYDLAFGIDNMKSTMVDAKTEISDLWDSIADLPPVDFVINIQKKFVNTMVENTLSEFDFTDPYMEQGTQSSNGQVPYFPGLKGGRTAEESGMIFADQVIIQSNNPVRER